MRAMVLRRPNTPLVAEHRPDPVPSADGREFFDVARQANVRTAVTPYVLADANLALDDLREGHVHGAAVLVPWSSDRSQDPSRGREPAAEASIACGRTPCRRENRSENGRRG